MRLTALPPVLARAAKHPALDAPEDARRRAALVAWIDERRARGMTRDDACRVAGVSPRSYTRWRRVLRAHGLRALASRSSRPRRPREAWKRREVRELIEFERLLWPAGKEKITWRLQRFYGVTVSSSTVGRVLSELLRRERIHRIGYAPSQTRRRARAARVHARRQARGERARAAGELVQIDTLVERSDGRVRYHFSAIDPVQRCAHARLYASGTSRNAAAFLRECLQRWPSPITSVQVDNGSEFMGAFEQACMELGIELVTIPPRSPKRNAKVERLQRTFRDEHYAYEPPSLDLEDANAYLDAYLHYYNHQRPHMGLGMRTPMEYASHGTPRTGQTS